MERLRSGVDRVLAWFLVVLMGTAVLNVLWQVLTRWVLDDPSSYTEELARYLLVWVGILGAAYAAGRKLHLAIDLVPSRLSGRSRRVMDAVIQACVITFAVLVMIIGGMRLVMLTLRFGQVSAALGVSLGHVYLVLPLSGLLITFYAVLHIVEIVRGEPVPAASAAGPATVKTVE